MRGAVQTLRLAKPPPVAPIVFFLSSPLPQRSEAKRWRDINKNKYPMKNVLTRARIFSILACCLLAPAFAHAATWTSSDKWATWSNGGYYIENDVWGSNPGPQVIWANSYSSWGVWANHTGGGIKSYPNVDKSVNIKVLSLKNASSSFNATTASGSVYDLAYDIWLNNSQYEVMIWTNWSNTKPIAASYDASGNAIPTVYNASIGGRTYNVYIRWNGSNAVISFLATSKTNSATIDIKSVLRWINSKGWYNNPTLSKIQFGWELITTPSGGGNYQINSYSATAN